MSKIGVVNTILEHPKDIQDKYNDVVASFRGSIKGRMGIPFTDELSIISIALVGEYDDICNFTKELEMLEGVTVNTSISKIEA
jgi:putative iron-only hydrogenase system regulator